MKNSRLLQLLETFSRAELREFDRFVRSPYFNRQDELVDLIGLLLPLLSAQRPVPEKPQIFDQLFPRQPYEDTQMRLMMSRLLKLAEQFLALNAWQADELGVQAGVMTAYRKRNLPAHFASAARLLSDRLEAGAYRDQAYHQLHFIREEQEHLLNSGQLRVRDLNLEEIHRHLDLAYFIAKLRYACLALSRQQVYRKDYDPGILPAVHKYIRENGLLRFPAVSLYFHALESLENPGKAGCFDRFKDLLRAHFGVLPGEESRDLLLIAINYCIRRLNEGERAFAHEGLALYQFGLEKGILTEKGELSRFTYRNIAAMAIKTDALDWAETFIHQYRDQLPSEYRESMYSFSLAQLAYRRRQFDQALDLLQKTEYQDVLLNLAAKTLQLKIYYENSAFDLLHSHLDAMKVFLGRKRILGYHRNNYLAIIRYAKKLLTANPYDKKALEKLRQQVESEESLTEREWLLEQIDALN